MLILSRKIGESIRINENITISIMDIDGRNIKLGIDAPKNVAIYREEIYLRIKEENQSAATSKVDLGSMAHLFNKKDPK
jgi:carbon storage regulator